MSGQQTQIDYAEFRKRYEQQHPASVPKRNKAKREYPLLIEALVLLMFICSALLSGVHTVPTVYSGMEQAKTSEEVRQVVALLSFVAVELAIFMSAYLLEKQKTLALIVLIATFLVAMISNLNSVNKALESNDEWAKAITVTLGIGAPLIALMSGKLYIVISNGNRSVQDTVERNYQKSSEDFDNAVLSAYEKYEQRFVRLSARLSAGQLADGQADTGADGQADRRTATGQGYTKRTDARTMVQDYLRSNPDEISGNVRVIAEKLGVGKSTVSEVQREFKGGGQVDIQQEADRIIGGQQHETQL